MAKEVCCGVIGLLAAVMMVMASFWSHMPDDLRPDIGGIVALLALGCTVGGAFYQRGREAENEVESTIALFKTDILTLLKVMGESFSRYRLTILPTASVSQLSIAIGPGEENYFAVFDNNAGSLSCLNEGSAAAITHFYRYTRAGREIFESSAKHWRDIIRLMSPGPVSFIDAFSSFASFDLLYFIDLLESFDSAVVALNRMDGLDFISSDEVLHKDHDRPINATDFRKVLQSSSKYITRDEINRIIIVKNDIATVRQRLGQQSQIVRTFIDTGTAAIETTNNTIHSYWANWEPFVWLIVPPIAESVTRLLTRSASSQSA